MENKIKVLFRMPGWPDFVPGTIENSLEAMQEYVGGYIEAVNIGGGLLVICNEEGVYEDLPYCCVIDHTVFRGNVFVCSEDGEEFADIPGELLEIIGGGQYAD